MPGELNAKEKAIVCGLYLSKFDREGLTRAGFQYFNEAIRAWGRLLNIAPGTIRNHRDYFDAHFPNHRKGWRKVPLPPAQKKVYEQFKDHTIDELSAMITEWGLT